MKQLTVQELRYLNALKRQRAIIDARDRLIPFARFMRPDPNHADDVAYSSYEAVRHHEVIAHALEAVESGLIRRLIINCPPRHGKSELASRLFPAWFIGRNVGASIIQASYNEKFSWDFGREVRQIIEDRAYQQVFPQVTINTASVDRVETMSGSKLFFTGRGGSITGRGSVGLVLDDLFKDRVEADSPTTREKVWNWFNQVARTRLLTSLGWIVLINCMTGDTPVMLADGAEKPLRDIRPGDEVATMRDGELSTSVVKNWINHGPDLVYTIKTSSGSVVRANARHPFLVSENGQLKWIKTSDLRRGHEMLRVNGGNGRAKPARWKGAASPSPSEATATPTTTRNAGPTAFDRLQSILSLNGERISDTVTELTLTTMSACSPNKGENAPFAELTLALGLENSVLITATTLEKLEGCSATTVISSSEKIENPAFLSSPKNQNKRSAPLRITSDFTLDKIVEVEISGVEDVFDIEVQDTENFIANRLTSSNTRWHEDDVVGRLTDPHNASYSEDEARKWRIIDLPALARDHDPLGRQEGEALWPKRFPVAYLEDLRTADPRGFQSLYQGSPTPDKGNFFDSAHIQTYTRAEMPKREDLRFYAASDHAVSTAQDRDKTCCGIMGVDKDANIWIMPDIVWGRYTTDYVVEQMIGLMSKFKPLFWWAERGHISKSIGPFLRKRMLERSVFCPIVEVTPTHDKKTRAQAINGRMAQRMVYFPSFAPWWGEARDQLLKFPFGSHDDFVDMLAWLGLGLGLQHVPHVKKPKDMGPKVGTLGWIKAEGKRPLTNSAGW